MQAILDQKVVITGNGLNIRQIPGTIQDLAPLISAMTGQTTVKYVEALAMADALIAKDPKSADVQLGKMTVDCK